MLGEIARVTLRVTQAFEQLGIPYAVGGSVASSLHGVMRSTLDVDIVADIKLEHVPALVSALSPEFYADEAGRFIFPENYLNTFCVHQKPVLFPLSPSPIPQSLASRRLSPLSSPSGRGKGARSGGKVRALRCVDAQLRNTSWVNSGNWQIVFLYWERRRERTVFGYQSRGRGSAD